jgi:hypothetical protein
MSTGSPDLERLISRYLDDEATPAERRELEARADADPTVESLLIETAAIDREIGRAMRIAMGRTIPLTARHRKKVRWIQAIGFAAAACIGLAVLLNPREKPSQPMHRQPAAPARASWFAPPAQQTDMVDQVDPADVRPQLRLRDTDRHWIVIPARQHGQFLLIQVDRLRTRAIRIQDDF